MGSSRGACARRASREAAPLELRTVAQRRSGYGLTRPPAAATINPTGSRVSSAPLHDSGARELVAALVLRHAGVTGHLDEADLGKEPRLLADPLHQLLVGLGLPA